MLIPPSPPPPPLRDDMYSPLCLDTRYYMIACRRTVDPVVRLRTRNVLCGWFGDVPCRGRLAPHGTSLCAGVGFYMYPTVPKRRRPSNDGRRSYRNLYQMVPWSTEVVKHRFDMWQA